METTNSKAGWERKAPTFKQTANQQRIATISAINTEQELEEANTYIKRHTTASKARYQ